MSASDRRTALVALTFVLLPLVACRFFVDLDGLGDGVRPDDAAGIDVTTASDASDGASADASKDAELIDAIVPDVDAAMACPSNGGPTPVRVPSVTGSFCIDATEVTRSHYLAFLNTSPSTAGQATVCAWNVDFTPTMNWPPNLADLEKPVGFVDWCDAVAFCNWAGKRLCGKIGGGALMPAELGTNQSQIYWACSGGGMRTYPYGNVYSDTACNGGNSVLEKVKARATCEGGFAGIYDLAGNVHEWMDGCVATADPTMDSCPTQGSAYDGHPQGDMSCDAIDAAERSESSTEAIGFRCCSD